MSEDFAEGLQMTTGVAFILRTWFTAWKDKCIIFFSSVKKKEQYCINTSDGNSV
jgi:hypothetical protein